MQGPVAESATRPRKRKNFLAGACGRAGNKATKKKNLIRGELGNVDTVKQQIFYARLSATKSAA